MRGALIGLAVALVGAIPPQPAPPPEATPAILSWRLNGQDRGEAVVLMSADVLLMEPALLAEAGLRPAPTHRTAGQAREYVNLSQIEGLRYQADAEAATLEIQAEPRLFGATVLDLSRRAPAEIEYRRDPSAFLNYAPTLFDGERLEGYAEAGASVGGFAAFSGLTSTPEDRARRGLSHITYEDRPRLHRWRLGDGFEGSGPLGGYSLLGGLTFSRDLSLDPYRRGAPGLGLSGAVDTPATVDVYVNDALVRSERVPAGAFTLENLPVDTGAGQVRYEIRDALGQRQAFDAFYYLAPQLLRAGEQEFAYTLGLRRPDLQAGDYDPDQPALVGRHRIGLTDGLTVGWGLEAQPSGASGGGQITLGLPIGGLEIGAQGSRWDGVAGAAGMLGYGYRGRQIGASAVVRGATPGYAHLSLDPTADRNLIDISGSLSLSLAQRVSLGVQQRVAQRRDVGRSHDSVLRLSGNLTPGFALQLTGSRSQPAGAAPPIWAGFASLGGTFDFGLSGRVGTQTSDQGPGQMDLGLSRALPREAGLGFDAQATLLEEGPHRGALTARAQSRFGRVLARYQEADQRSHHVLEAAGGIAWVAGGGIHLTQPVQQAFAVVDAASLPDVEVRLDNNPVATTDADGRALLPWLLPYYANRISINARALPMDQRIEQVEQTIAPPARGGALVIMRITRALFVRGRALVRGPDPDQPAAYGRLTLRVGDETLSSPVGEDGAFELEALAPGLWPGVLRTGDGRRCLIELNVPTQAEGPIVDLGVVECVELVFARRGPAARGLAARGGTP